MRVEVYDRLASIYDERYVDENCQQENKQIAEMVRDLHPNPRLLDVGCGTGLALELELCELGKYQGVDPSAGMLLRFLQKFPMLEGGQMLRAPFEKALDDNLLESPYDVVISLFGSPSYVDPLYQERIVAMAPRGLMMHYLPGYHPDYEDDIPIADRSMARAEAAVLAVGGRAFEFHNFQVSVW